MVEDEKSLEEIIKKKTGGALELGGGIGSYALAFEISGGELIALVRNKRVIDLGSSEGVFAKECAQRNIPTKIFSISPRLAFKFFRDSEKERTRYLDKNGQQVKRIQELHDKTAVSAFAQALPFESESIDIILDSFAVYHYADLRDFVSVVKEEFRVLRKGGEIRMVSAVKDDKFLNERREKLRELQISFEEIKNKVGGGTIGFRIVKPT